PTLRQLTELQQYYPQLSLRTKNIPSVLGFFCENFRGQPRQSLIELNLLQGDFPIPATDATSIKIGRRLVQIASAWCIAQFILATGELAYFSHQSDRF